MEETLEELVTPLSRDPHGGVPSARCGAPFQPGAASCVLDGGAGDLEQLGAMVFPVFARLVTPAIAQRRWSLVALNEPINVSAQMRNLDPAFSSSKLERRDQPC